MLGHDRRAQNHEAFGLSGVGCGKRAVEIVGTADLENMQMYAQGGRGLLQGSALVFSACDIPQDGDP
jgi:hypothetical protein